MVSFALLGASVMQNATAPLAGSVVLPVVPPAEAAAPLAQSIAPLVEAATPLAQTAAPLAQTATPLAQAAAPLASAASTAANTAASTASTLGEAGFSWGGYFQAIGVLFLLLAVLWGAVWVARKYGKFNFMPKPGAFPRDALRVEAQLPLGPRKGVMVVRFLNKRLLLGVTDHQITLLTESADDHDECNITEFKDILQEEQRQKTDA